MTRILRIIAALGFLWWLGKATMAVAPIIESDQTGGAGFGLFLAWIAILLFWILVDKVLRMLGEIFGRKHA